MEIQKSNKYLSQILIPGFGIETFKSKTKTGQNKEVDIEINDSALIYALTGIIFSLHVPFNTTLWYSVVRANNEGTCGSNATDPTNYSYIPYSNLGAPPIVLHLNL